MPPVPPVSPTCDVLALWGRDGCLTPPLVPLVHGHAPIAGQARTVQLTVADDGPGLAPFYDEIFHAPHGVVLVMAGAGSAGAIWGEILSTALATAGGVCALVDGFARDVAEIEHLGLPVYAHGITAVGPNGRVHVTGIDVDVAIGDVTISPGDTIIADSTGCVRVRADDHDAVTHAARRYADAEATVLAAVRDGVALADAYRAKAEVVASLVGESVRTTNSGGVR